MAKENYISLRGQLRKPVQIVRNALQEPQVAIFALCTVTRDLYDRAGMKDPSFQRPIIMTSDPLMVRKAMQIQVHDIVEIKGTFTTGHSNKKRICPHCNAINVISTPFQTITPTYIGILRTGLPNDAAGMQELTECAEISNIAKVIGRVCTPTEDIRNGSSETGHKFTKYRIAVNRKLRLLGSQGYEDHSDFVPVISYDETAEDDHAVLRQGSLIYIDGYVHTMMVREERECTQCHEKFSFKNQHMILTPYASEYLRDYNDDVLPETHPVEEEAQDETNTRTEGENE